MASKDEPADTRQRILHVTLRLIGEHGIAAVSNRRIAAEANVALGSLTYHFPSQTELLRESLLLHVSDEVARVTAIARELRSSKHDLSRIASEVERVVERSADDYGTGAELELHLHAARDVELRDASWRCFAAYEDFAAPATSPSTTTEGGRPERSRAERRRCRWRLAGPCPGAARPGR